MGNKLPCSCCENSSTPKNSSMKINVVVNSEQASYNCLPSDIDASRCEVKSNSASLIEFPEMEKYFSFGCRGLGLHKNKQKLRGLSMNGKGTSKENEFKLKNKSLRPGKNEIRREIPCVTIDLVKKVKNKLKK